MNKSLKAIYDDDLDEYLDDLGILSKFKAGKILCAFCREEVNYKNLHSIFPDSGVIKMTCSNADCVKKAMQKFNHMRYGEKG